MKLKHAIAAVCATVTCGAPFQNALAANGPNFVTIVIDDMGFSDMGSFGGEIDTPNLDQLANQGTRLTNFYSAPTSTPARAMFFTGKDNHKAGVGNMGGYAVNRPPQGNLPEYLGELRDDVTIFPEVLQANGYSTMMTGKWDLGSDPGKYAHDRGFDDTLVLLPGGDIHFLSDADGNLITSQPTGYQRSPYNKNGEEFTDFPPNAFSTEFYTDSALEMLDDWVAGGKQQPFYLNIAHIASHAPFQAPADLIEKYLPIYSQGWDVLREQRFNKLKQQGYIPADAPLPPRPGDAPAWNSLSDAEKQVEARRMAIYAGLVEMLDRSVGDLVQHLKDIGEYDNTVLFVFSDNGAAAIEAGAPRKQKFVADNFAVTNEKLDAALDDPEALAALLPEMGGPDSFVAAVEGWGMLSNTPFNRYKAETFEGGMHTAAFVHYPNRTNGGTYECVTSVMDIAPTILEMAGISYPDEVPMDGIPMTTALSGNASGMMEGGMKIPGPLGKALEGRVGCPGRAVAFELDSGIMVRKGDWKLAQQWDFIRQRWDSNVYLFNVKEDFAEQNDLSAQYPEKYAELMAIYDAYAEENNVVPVGSRLYSPTSNLDVIIDGVESSEGMVIGGIMVNYNANWRHNAAATAKSGNTVDIAMEIYPPADHIGMPAKVVVAAYYQPETGEPMLLTFGGGERADTAYGITSWDGDMNTLPAFMSYPAYAGAGDTADGLPERVEIPIYEGILLGGMTGRFDFWAGYQLADGTMLSNGTKTVSLEVSAE